MTLSEPGKAVSENRASFDILPDMNAQAGVTTDKISYNPNETVTLNSTIISLSGNYAFENMSAEVTISRQETAGSSQVYTETRTIKTLMPGAAFTFKTYWNAGTNAPGHIR